MFKPLTPKTIEYTTTPNGKLRGFKQRDIYNFLGVPYGECKRWQTATPVKPWKGIRNAVQFGNRAFPASVNAQAFFTPWDSCGVAHEAYDYSEDCLNLNIWTPSIEDGAKKPVMVWIHGGGYQTGSGMEMQAHDGENLARFGDVVVVGLNHRLNIFGFMDMSQFGEKYKNSANCGLSDLVLALKWVQENIAAFGGDPDNVMIYGQSGGGGKVRALLQIPEAAGLFHKAVIMSGAWPIAPDGESNATSLKVLDYLLKKYNTDSIETLEALEPEELLEALYELPAEIKAGGMIWHPIANDWYPGCVAHVGIQEHARKIPVMIGTAVTEFPLMRVFNKHQYSEEQQLAIVQECFPDQDITKMVELFKQAWPGRCLTDITEIYGGMDFRAGSVAYADARAAAGCAPTYMYILAHDFPQQGGRCAWHCADIPIVFHNAALYPENFHDGLLEGLEDAVCASWVNMLKNGDPNNDYLGVQWPAYKAGECAVMILDNVSDVRYDFDRALRAERQHLKLTPMEKYQKFENIIN